MFNSVVEWMNDRIEQKEVEKLKAEFTEISEEAADVAATRIAIKNDYGSIVEEAAEVATERIEIKEETSNVIYEVAAVFADRTSIKQTTFHLLKGNIGPGCLSLPWAFTQLGIGVGCVMTILVGLWTYYNCVSLLQMKQRYTSNRRTLTYADMGQAAYGKHCRNFISWSIILFQMAICTVFLSFVAANTQAFYADFCPSRSVLSSSTTLNILMAAPFAAGLTLLPNLKALGPVSEFATGVLFSAFGVLLAVLILNWDMRPGELPSIDWVTAPMAVSSILYSFEGICIVLPLEASMKDRSKFMSVFSYSYVAVTTIYCVVGGVCVWILGAVTEGSITAFLLHHHDKYEGDTLVTIANLMVSITVLGTYALTMFPCIELWCQGLDRKAQGYETLDQAGVEEDDGWPGGSLAFGPFDTPVLRLSLVACTVLAAAIIPNVRQLIGLAGAIAGASMALILPPLLALRFEEMETNKLTRTKIMNYVLLLLGVIFGIFGACAAVYDIIQSFAK